MIGIVGGTFDPVHYGHLRPVHHLTQEMDFSKIHYVLSARPPHRDPPVASVAHRFEMLSMAVSTYPEFLADDQEVRRPGPSFTLWTVRQLRQRYGSESLCLIMGLDAYLGIHLWFRWQDSVALGNIVVWARQGWETDVYEQSDGVEDLCKKGSGAVVFVQSLELPITATEVRKKLNEGGDASNEVPTDVLEYIRKNKIYGTN